MTDQHQVNSMIANVICDCLKNNPDRRIDPEVAKYIAKCIVSTLTEAGLAIVVADPTARQGPV
jgi:hypothetical protein